jgi:hypothetical protein
MASVKTLAPMARFTSIPCGTSRTNATSANTGWKSAWSQRAWKPGETIVFGDLNDPDSPISKFRRKYGDSLLVLKPDEKTEPQVQYRGLDRSMEKKVPKGRNHDPRSYEIETWAVLESTFDKAKSDRT